MKALLGLLILALAAAVFCGGVYYSVVVCLIGGIVDIINQIKSETTDAHVVAWALVKVIFCEIPFVVGMWVGIILGVFGIGLMNEQ